MITENLTSVETKIIEASPKQVLKRNGQTFYFASRIFSAEQLFKVSTLYSLCRYIDDCADENEPVLARSKLDRLQILLQQITQDQLETSSLQNESEQWFADKVKSVTSWGVQSRNLFELLKGAQEDLNRKPVSSESELYDYCYLVAGVVGLMMCSLIGVRDHRAYKFAVDLGIAMQLTNICRDVAEDFDKQRIYLPELAPLGNLYDKSSHVEPVVRKYLDLADFFYENGRKGLSYIPLRERIVILLASEGYRSIGNKIRKKHYQVLKGRVFLNSAQKLLVAFKSLRFLLSPRFWRANKHALASGYDWQAQ